MLQQSILVILATFVNSLLGVTPSLGCGKPLPSQPHAGHSHNFDAWVQDPNLGEVNLTTVNVFEVFLFFFRPTGSIGYICQQHM